MLTLRRRSGGDVTPGLRLLRLLGRGGMGTLWIAEHRALGEQVVVKFLNDELADDPAAAGRVAREAAAGARVRSAHVVQILDHGACEGSPFIVMELLRGRDLRVLLETRRILPISDTVTIVCQLAKALARTHAEGLVHRDVKPSNIFLVDGEGAIFVKLLDFGLAQNVPRDDSSVAVSRPGAGTPPYMSPEQIAGEPVDVQSDIWSLGTVAFECLTGRRPFQGETAGAVALAIHTLELPRPSDVNPELAGAIDAWFARVCARRPEGRFSSATEAAEAMAQALGGDPRPSEGGPCTRGVAVDRTLTDPAPKLRIGFKRRAVPARARLKMSVLVLAGVLVAAVAGLRAARSQQAHPFAAATFDEHPTQFAAMGEANPDMGNILILRGSRLALQSRPSFEASRGDGPTRARTSSKPLVASPPAALTAVAATTVPLSSGPYELPDERF